jgi:hypothetical protein
MWIILNSTLQFYVPHMVEFMLASFIVAAGPREKLMILEIFKSI